MSFFTDSLVPSPPPHCYLAYFLVYLILSHLKGSQHRYLRRYKGSDKWCKSRLVIDGFNELFKNVAVSYLKVGNDSIIEISFWTKAKGGLPILSYISASHNHWGHSSILCHVRTCSPYRYMEERKILRRAISVWRLGQHQPS